VRGFIHATSEEEDAIVDSDHIVLFSTDDDNQSGRWARWLSGQPAAALPTGADPAPTATLPDRPRRLPAADAADLAAEDLKDTENGGDGRPASRNSK
jgi:hypothetical protein